MRTERKKHHTSDFGLLKSSEETAILLPEIEPFEAPKATKAEVKALEQRAQIKTQKALEIKRAKQKKKLDEENQLQQVKAELAKAKRKSAPAVRHEKPF